MAIQNKIIFSHLFLMLCFFSCKEKWNNVIVKSDDNKYHLTILTIDKVRYIINGDVDYLPKDNFIKLDISKVDRLGDAICVCWNDGGKEWKLYNTYASVIENKLDTNKFLYKPSLGVYGEPSSVGYIGKNCGSFLIREYTSPKGALVLEYR